MSATPDAERTTRAWTALAVLVGFALRLARPEVHSFWIDEGMTVAIATSDDPFALLRHDSHPPLLFLIVRAWIGAFGQSDLALRLFPALVSCASVLAFAALARAWLGRERAAWAIALHAVSPLLVWYAHEVRMYAFVECAALVVMLVARASWTAPSMPRWIALAAATAVATGLHYYGALAGLVVVAQALVVRGRPRRRTILAAGAGVAVWLPWLLAYLPRQLDGTWPIIAQTSPRDWAELPLRLVAVDLIVLVEHGLGVVGYVLGALCLLGFVAGCARAYAERSTPAVDAAIAALTPIAGAAVLVVCAGGGFQPRYLTTAIPGAIALVALGFAAPRPRVLGRFALAATIACAAATTLLQLSENRREDYRTAAAEILERWRDGDRLLLLVCVPATHVGAAVEHYLRDRPDVLAARLDADAYLSGADRPPSGTRVHVLWRESSLCWEPMHEIETTHAVIERSPGRFRIHRSITTVP